MLFADNKYLLLKRITVWNKEGACILWSGGLEVSLAESD
jgi:hypothetical protein